MMKWFYLVLQRMQKIWLALGWRKAGLLGGLLIGSLVLSFLLLHDNSKDLKSSETLNPQSQVAASNDNVSQIESASAETTPSGSQTSTSTQPHSSASTPKNQDKKTPATAPTLNFSVSEISVHAGWESSNAVASISSGEELSGVSKEWNDNSPLSVAMPLGTKAGKTIPFFVTVPFGTTPGTYTVKIKASAASQSYTANLTVRVLPPLFAFGSIVYDAGLQGYVINLQIYDTFTGDVAVQLSGSSNTPCSGNQYFIDQLDDSTFTLECQYGFSGVSGNYPLTFSVSDGKKTWTKNVTWTY